jgi:hypothetical protein
MDTKKKRVSETEMKLIHLAGPSDANNLGFAHGGVVMKLLGELAYACASAPMPCTARRRSRRMSSWKWNADKRQEALFQGLPFYHPTRERKRLLLGWDGRAVGADLGAVAAVRARVRIDDRLRLAHRDASARAAVYAVTGLLALIGYKVRQS